LSESENATKADLEAIKFEMATLKRQNEDLTRKLASLVTTLSMPMSTGKKLETVFKLIEVLSAEMLKPIIKNYVKEARSNNLKFDDMIEPMYVVFGLDRLQNILDDETIQEHYGEWAVNRWRLSGR